MLAGSWLRILQTAMALSLGFRCRGLPVAAAQKWLLSPGVRVSGGVAATNHRYQWIPWA